MKQTDYLGIVPPQKEGKEIEAFASVKLADERRAREFYERAKRMLLEVNKWQELSGAISATFRRVGQSGSELQGCVEKGDYMRIDIPGPGSSAGEGFDWVRVEDLREVSGKDVQSVGFRVRPEANPAGDPTHVAHFYDDSSTSSFMVTRSGNEVTAYIVDRNTRPNDDSAGVADKIRNTPVALGAIGAFSKIQWQNLADGIIDTSGVDG